MIIAAMLTKASLLHALRIYSNFALVLDYASMKADILHIQTSLDKLTSLEQAPGIAELLCRKPTSPLVAFI
ncbi:hypothetical protein T06_10799 [Trichinella sp. T6]|nr:hypothetical protein T06_10799 [Trichinella sp. T6]